MIIMDVLDVWLVISLLQTIRVSGSARLVFVIESPKQRISQSWSLHLMSSSLSIKEICPRSCRNMNNVHSTITLDQILTPLMGSPRKPETGAGTVTSQPSRTVQIENMDYVRL